MATLMRDGFAARLGVIKFDQRFGFWLRDFGFRITAFVSSSVAARLSEDSFDFHEMLMRLHALSAVHRARARSPPGGAVR